MENASRALLMAAGTLIGILVLSLGIYLYANFRGAANQLYDEMEINQINQFNVQFTKYVGKDNITIYDVITVVNLAKDNNYSKELEQDSAGNDYITVELKNHASASDNHMENLSVESLNQLLKNETLQDNKLPTYDCEVTISEITRMVKKVTFNKK